MHARQHGRNTSILIVRNQQAEISNLRRANPIRVFRRETLYSIPARKTEFFNFHERERERGGISTFPFTGNERYCCYRISVFV